MKKEYRAFFFFSFYHIGGAEKVHAQIAQATGGADTILFFTKKSDNNLFLDEFKNSGCRIVDISGFTGNKWLYFMNLIWRGVISGYINSQKQPPAVFNGQCNFAYKISPWLKKNIPQVELIHSFNTFSYIRIPFISFITRTVMISQKRIEDHAVLYEKAGIPAAFLERIQYIPNAVRFPAVVKQKDPSAFTVVYVGRGGIEKRVPLVVEIARRLHENNSNVQFEILGDVSNIIDASKYDYIRFHGNQHNPELIHRIYERSNVLLLTSNTEGFPLVVIEAMSYGAAIIATPVGDIPRHVKSVTNGYIFSTIDEEDKIIAEAVVFILKLRDDRQLLDKISENNRRYAGEHFTIEKFNHAYQNLFESVNKKN
ncbi:MAG: glycosyltransferase family 4 protein [Chitinophagaceae bacterium]